MHVYGFLLCIYITISALHVHTYMHIISYIIKKALFQLTLEIWGLYSYVSTYIETKGMPAIVAAQLRSIAVLLGLCM